MTDAVILAAPVPPTTRINALRLLDLAHPDNGHVVVFWEELCALWQCAEGTARRHLGLMHQAGLVHYSSNGDGCAYVTFRHLSRVGARKSSDFSTQSARGRAPEQPAAAPEQPFDARGRAENDHQRAENARPRAFSVEKTDATSHAGLVGWLVGSTDQPDPEPTNQPAAPDAPPEPQPEPQPSVAAAVACAGLLRVRMRGDQAKAIAAHVPLAVIREAVGAWWMLRKSVGGQFADHPGIVVTWLREWHRTRATPWPEPPARWRAEPLYRLMCTPAELDALAAAEQAERDALAAELATPDAPPEPPQARDGDRAEPEPGSAAAIWREFVRDRLSGGQIADGDELAAALHPASTVERIIVRTPAARLELDRKRLTPGWRRRLSAIAGHPVAVEFVEEEE